jgi:hypothetical protein
VTEPKLPSERNEMGAALRCSACLPVALESQLSSAQELTTRKMRQEFRARRAIGERAVSVRRRKKPTDLPIPAVAVMIANALMRVNETRTGAEAVPMISG